MPDEGDGEFKGYTVYVTSYHMLLEVWARDAKQAKQVAAVHTWMMSKREQGRDVDV